MGSRSSVVLLGCLLLLANSAAERLVRSAEKSRKPPEATAAVKPPATPAAPAPAPPPQKCWDAPVMTTILEIFQSQTSSLFSSADAAISDRSVLALSSGDLDAAYGAGLLVGWGETGTRPEFSVVTGVGASVLIAPFAFLGEAGDQNIGDLFNCNVSSFKELANSAAARLDETALAAIANGHRAGRRLYLVTPASDNHPAIVWNAGLIAASGDPKALTHLRRIFVAAIDQGAFLEPRQIPVAAGAAATEDESLRLTGAGGLFFVPEESAPSASKQRPHYFLINNGKMRANENRAFMAFASEKYANQKDKLPNTLITTSLGLFSRAQRDRNSFHFAYIAPSTPLTSHYNDEIDPQYSREMFLRAWKTAHTGGGWQTMLPGQEP